MPKTEKIHYLKEYQPPAYRVSHVDMDADLRPGACTISTSLYMEPAPGTRQKEPVFLDGTDLQPEEILLDGKKVPRNEYRLSRQGLTLENPPGRPFVLKTKVTIEPEKNSDLMGLYRTGGVWCTQCEPEGFRRITFMLDRPDNMATYRVRLEADREMAPVLLSNGNLVEKADLEKNRHHAIWEDPHPKPTYLFAMVGGKLEMIRDEFITKSGKNVELAIYCEPGKKKKCAYAMGALKRAMKWDEKRFGREYDLETFNVVAVSDFNFGAMENKSLNIFNDKYILADPDSATDMDYYNIERIVAHEYFHNWTGNRITCRDWFQLCLKEGLTVYRDQEFTSDMRSRATKRISDARNLMAFQFAEDKGPLAHPPRPDRYVQINNLYTSTVYEKGAEIVRMLATLLGEEQFARGMELYFRRHDGQATTIESWIKVFQDSSGRDLSQFARWYVQAGTPEVFASGFWDENSNTYMLHLKQVNKPTPGQDSKLPLCIPLKFALLNARGKEMTIEKVSGGTVEGDVIILDKSEIELVFSGIGQRPVLSLLRQFSAPIALANGQTREEKIFLATHDGDPFNRWQAGQDMAMEMMTRAIRNNRDYCQNDVDELAAAIRNTLKSRHHDDEFKALTLLLPSEKAIAMALREDINPGQIHELRQKLQILISRKLQDMLLEILERPRITTGHSQNIKQVQERSLRNRCLMLLVAQNEKSMIRMARKQYENCDNMSDRMGALGAMVMGSHENSLPLLEDFRQKYKDDPLVHDKYLALVAQIPDRICLDKITEIYESRDFPLTNPNRVRALIGGFAAGNPAQFTRRDGAGFELVARVIGDIDPINPQVAASLLEAFGPFG